mmetsp:Transcript_19331/g.42158  ORF Transcript_19331/g.42158 Transcript_19331/m.42158 type:complete len:80 (+) Transcript_19331:1452-1691(+)
MHSTSVSYYMRSSIKKLRLPETPGAITAAFQAICQSLDLPVCTSIATFVELPKGEVEGAPTTGLRSIAAIECLASSAAD